MLWFLYSAAYYDIVFHFTITAASRWVSCSKRHLKHTEVYLKCRWVKIPRFPIIPNLSGWALRKCAQNDARDVWSISIWRTGAEVKKRGFTARCCQTVWNERISLTLKLLQGKRNKRGELDVEGLTVILSINEIMKPAAALFEELWVRCRCWQMTTGSGRLAWETFAAFSGGGVRLVSSGCSPSSVWRPAENIGHVAEEQSGVFDEPHQVG